MPELQIVTPSPYTRLNDTGMAFEEERNLMKLTFGLDGGGSVAADGSGNVYVAWHGSHPGDPEGEDGRSVWIARSRDGGKDFLAEAPAYKEPTGACGCCGLSIFTGSNGMVYVLYRTAKEKVHRDTYLLVSKDDGKTFAGRAVDKWNIGACPQARWPSPKALGWFLPPGRRRSKSIMPPLIRLRHRCPRLFQLQERESLGSIRLWQ